jgi:adenine-specific DNA-methyltransferase
MIQERQASIQRDISERNMGFIDAESVKVYGWADDLRVGLQWEIKELDYQIRGARRAAAIALTLEEKLASQKQIKALEAQRNQKRRHLFDAEDQAGEQYDELMGKTREKMQQQTELHELFTIRWHIR